MTKEPQRLPEKIYVRRRVAAAVIILVVVALVIWGLVSWGRSSSESEGTAASSQTTSALPAPVTTPTVPEPGKETTEEETKDQETTEESSTSEESEEETSENPADKKTCELADLKIEASTDKPTYEGGEQPTMYMKVHNPTKADCVIELEDDTLRFEVYDLASNERMWADTDCYPSVVTGEQKFKAGEDRNFEAVWSRMGSAPGQCSGRSAVPEGAYMLYGVLGDNPSDAATFNLKG
ncbi:hypothetical protein QP027_09600 [Corynebacterium breve]|uniref:Secreted protein n=1 Tax=Corynebacterium breve TaxID=3049799 RepID=A0ABY8VDD7_9CORY|nr:hypothetical protein [Corynebacterium breve]WIM67347.1 hypothetical protein QP027_09600 [Corynebacterium breve]